MDILHLTEKDYITSRWSGGTTTQLYIHPKDGDYASRRFDFRISSASVELGESVFTSLPGIRRFITPLDGCLELRHKGHHSAKLNPLEVDSFPGSWETVCLGRARDFNLMIGSRCDGEMCVFTPSGEMTLLPCDTVSADCFFFLGDGYYVINGRRETAQPGDLVLLFLHPGDRAAQLVLPPRPIIHCQVAYL